MMTDNYLLRAIYDFRHWDAEPGSSSWDELIHFWGDNAIEYATQQLADRWFSDEAIQDLQDSALFVELMEEFFEFYLWTDD